MLNKIRIVLVSPSHPGNIGACARAMKVMGLSQLYLVNPKSFPHPEATARATGAEDILDKAVVVNDLVSALDHCEVVYGMSARSRSLAWPTFTPRQMAAEILNHHRSTALVFGSERTGLTNEELAICHFQVQIPTQPEFKSLNLAAAVQVMVYELYLASDHSSLPTQTDDDEALATTLQMEGFYEQLEQVMRKTDYLDPNHPKLLMQRLRRLFQRARVNQTEFNILRGILTSVQKRLIE